MENTHCTDRKMRFTPDDHKKIPLLCDYIKKNIFMKGYRPERGGELYSKSIDGEKCISDAVNCFGHIFNFTNEQILGILNSVDNDIDFYRDVFSVPGITVRDKDKAAKQLLKIISDCGLLVKRSNIDKPINNACSWRIALYFESGKPENDFHFLLEESTGVWSSKCGYEADSLDYIHQEIPPEKYQTYELYSIYTITNPFIKIAETTKNFKRGSVESTECSAKFAEVTTISKKTKCLIRTKNATEEIHSEIC